MSAEEPIPVEVFYRYGHRGRDMIAIRAPFAMSAGGRELIGRAIRTPEGAHWVLGVLRQASGPIQKGEPIGVETGDGERRAGE